MIPAYGETITLLRTSTTGTDDYGNDVLTDVELPVRHVAVWPRSASSTSNGESSGEHSTVIAGLSLLVPPGVAIKATDRVRVRGEIYEVEGEPGHWRSYLTNTDAGTEVALRRVTG
jgi:hypothetical protein